ncbi:hypothetical protein GC197_13050 [bacterium]|nr:hypothetical protein [bacterium]
MSDVKCPDCDLEMEAGFPADHSQGFYSISRWIRGDLTFLKTIGIASESFPITTYRCPDCGLLRSYAANKIS